MADTNTNQPANDVVELTQEGFEELKEELQDLEKKLEEVIDRVATARSYGDLKENAEYHDAKAEQEFTETRIDQVKEALAKAKVVKKTRSSTKVGIGSQVKVVKQGKKSKKQTFTIVGEFQSDPEEGKISVASPLGKALLGKKKSEIVKVETPGGQNEYLIEEIS